MLKEYLMRENDFISRADPNKCPTTFKSYIFQQGDHTTKYKCLINRMFTQERLVLITNFSLKAFQRSVLKLTEQVTLIKDAEGFADLDIMPFVKEAMNELCTSMAFGDYDSLAEDIKELGPLIEDVFDRHNSSQTDDWHIYSLGLSSKFNFGPGRKNVDRDFSRIFKVLGRLYDERIIELQTPGFVNNRCPNMIDHFISENLRDKSLGLTKEALLSDLFNTIFASLDGNRTALLNSFYLMSQYTDAQKAVHEQLSKLYFGKKLVQCDKDWAHNTLEELSLMNAFILEQFRFFMTSYSNVDRVVVKDFKIGNLTLFKGLQVLPFLCGPFQSDECYDNPNKFDIYRHTEETCRNLGNRDKLYPFSIG